MEELKKITGYELSRQWFDFAFEQPEKIKPSHAAIYFFACEHKNRLGGKEKFGLPSTMVMEAVGIKSYNTYINTLNDLVDWGFITMIQRSKNQYSSNIIALSKFNKALDKALDKAFVKHDTKQSESTVQSIDSIIKQINNKQINKEQVKELKLSVDNFLNDNPTKVEPINFDVLLDYINEKTNRSFRTINKNIKAKYKARLKEGYTKKDIQTAIDNAVKTDYHKENGFKYLTPEFFSRADKIDLFSQTTEKEYISPEQQYANNVMAEIERVKNLKK
jgi:uncharacterized phage protein (TIGR02220 family)